MFTGDTKISKVSSESMLPDQILITESSAPKFHGEEWKTAPNNTWNGSTANLNLQKFKKLPSTSTELPNQWSMMLLNTKLESSRTLLKLLKISPNGLSQDLTAILIASPTASLTRTELLPLLHQLKLSWVTAPEAPTAPLTSMEELELMKSKEPEDTYTMPREP